VTRERDEQELRNGLEVMDWISHLARHPEVPLDLDLICYINRLVLQKTARDFWGGRLRAEVDWHAPEDWSRPRALLASEKHTGLAVTDERTGQILVEFPPAGQVRFLLDELIAWVNSPEAQAFHPLERAALFHLRFTAIHPFRDGNGRTVRALVTLLLWREGYGYELLVLQQILDEQRDAYINALRAADAGDVAGWVEFFVGAVQTAVREMLRLSPLPQGIRLAPEE
jgi:fido (protein-threonine AMPylation protein)